jgi:hypothetical protein
VVWKEFEASGPGSALESILRELGTMIEQIEETASKASRESE